jgi:hypothetical protein
MFGVAELQLYLAFDKDIELFGRVSTMKEDGSGIILLARGGIHHMLDELRTHSIK